MYCLLKMDQVLSKENKTLKKYWKIGKNTEKVGEFCQSGKLGNPDTISGILQLSTLADLRGGGREGRMPPLPRGSKFCKFRAVFGKIWQYPGSTTGHWLRCVPQKVAHRRSISMVNLCV